jgi:hypothetical protein
LKLKKCPLQGQKAKPEIEQKLLRSFFALAAN